jgi:hypothetical protein
MVTCSAVHSSPPKRLSLPIGLHSETDFLPSSGIARCMVAGLPPPGSTSTAHSEAGSSATPSTFGETVSARASSGIGSFPRERNRSATLSRPASTVKQARRVLDALSLAVAGSGNTDPPDHRYPSQSRFVNNANRMITTTDTPRTQRMPALKTTFSLRRDHGRRTQRA